MTTQAHAPGLDFNELSLQDAIDLAVLIEEEARDRYEELATQLEVHRTPEAGRFFRFMEGIEEKHRVALAARRHELFGEAPSRVSRAMLFDVEAPEYEHARAFMTVREALRVALHAEEKAAAFFHDALPRVGDAGVRALFEELHEEEIEHQRLVNAQIAKAPPDPEIHPSEFADEPVDVD